MIENIIITIFSIIGLIFSLKHKGAGQKIITIGLFFAIIMTWFGLTELLFYSILLQLFLAFFSLIYGIVSKHINLFERILISVTGLVFTAGTLFKIQHYPFQNELRLLLIIPIVIFIWLTVKNKRKQPKEFGFMLIWIILSIISVIKLFMNFVT